MRSTRLLPGDSRDLSQKTPSAENDKKLLSSENCHNTPLTTSVTRIVTFCIRGLRHAIKKDSVLLNGTEGLYTTLAKARTEYLLGVLDNWTEKVPFR
jgi:hypothetical protein